MMNVEEMIAIAQKESFTMVTSLSTKQLCFNPDFRLCCEENTCGNYGKNYGCPPDCGTPSEMEEKALSYDTLIAMETKMDVEDINDTTVIKEIKKEHLRKSRKVISEYTKSGVSGSSAMPGISSLCTTCKKVENQPCAFPDKRTSCLSAYCIDVTKLATSCQSKVDWSGRSVSYFSLFFFNKDKNV